MLIDHGNTVAVQLKTLEGNLVTVLLPIAVASRLGSLPEPSPNQGINGRARSLAPSRRKHSPGYGSLPVARRAQCRDVMTADVVFGAAYVISMIASGVLIYLSIFHNFP
jgi:hypothetical protein